MTDGQIGPPAPLIELALCRLYHCDPVTLKRIPLATVLKHLTCIGAENYVDEQQARIARARANRKS